MTGKPYNALFGLPLPGFIHLTCPHYWREGQRGRDRGRSSPHAWAASSRTVIAREGADTIAGFVAEPVMGAGGVIPPSEGYFQAVAPILQPPRHPAVADEVICGFGRTGETLGLPDLRLRARRDHRVEGADGRLLPDGRRDPGPRPLRPAARGLAWRSRSSPTASPPRATRWAAAIALKAIDLIVTGDDARPASRQRAAPDAALRGGAAPAGRDTPTSANGAARGSWARWRRCRTRRRRRPFPGTSRCRERIANTCTDHGLICRPLGQSIVLCPPFVMTDAQMDEMFDKLDAALRAGLRGGRLTVGAEGALPPLGLRPIHPRDICSSMEAGRVSSCRSWRAASGGRPAGCGSRRVRPSGRPCLVLLLGLRAGGPAGHAARHRLQEGRLLRLHRLEAGHRAMGAIVAMFSIIFDWPSRSISKLVARNCGTTDCACVV